MAALSLVGDPDGLVERGNAVAYRESAKRGGSDQGFAVAAW